MAELNTRAALIAEAEAATPSAPMRKELLAELAASTGHVGGTLSLKNGTQANNELTIAVGWNRCDAFFDRSVDTKGVRDGIADATGAYLEIKLKGDGDWMMGLSLRCYADTAGTYQVRLPHVDDQGVSGTTPYEDEIILDAPGWMSFVIIPGLEKNWIKGEKFAPEIKGPNGAKVWALNASATFYRTE